jgi:hypothetical protein
LVVTSAAVMIWCASSTTAWALYAWMNAPAPFLEDHEQEAASGSIA